jgi:ABC-2 type transport system permease protein
MGLPHYPLFLIPGFLAWTFTFSGVTLASESIIGSKHLITKIAFPIEILTLISVSVALFDFVVSMSLYLLAIVILPPTIPITALALPLVMLIQILFTVGLAMLVACGSVYFRDVPKLVQILGTILFFLTPIFYPIQYIPDFARPLTYLNPMVLIVTLYHNLLYDQAWPDISSLVLGFGIALAFFVVGNSVFARNKNAFAELT